MSTLLEIALRIEDRSMQIFSESPALLLGLLREGDQLQEEIQQIRTSLLAKADELLRQHSVILSGEEPIAKAVILNLRVE